MVREFELGLIGALPPPDHISEHRKKSHDAPNVVCTPILIIRCSILQPLTCHSSEPSSRQLKCGEAVVRCTFQLAMVPRYSVHVEGKVA